MSKIVFDSDGLIKLVHSGVFERIKHTCLITEEVYRETVIEGKKRLYEDAFEIERYIKKKKLKVKKVKYTLKEPSLGRGELSTFALFKQSKACSTISDDQRFLTWLEEKGVPYITPTEFIADMVTTNQIKKKEGLQALRKIKAFIRKENYESAVKALGGKP